MCTQFGIILEQLKGRAYKLAGGNSDLQHYSMGPGGQTYLKFGLPSLMKIPAKLCS